MSIRDCIRKAGKALDRDDADAILAAIDESGISEQDAIDQQIAAVEAELTDIRERAVAAGATVVQPEIPDVSRTAPSAPAQPGADQGGERGTGGVLPEPDVSLPGNEGRERDGSLAGLPRRVSGVVASVFRRAVEAAEAYTAARGLPYRPPYRYVRINPERATRIADEFERMAHDPQNPEVKAAYAAMIEETVAQYEAILATGLKIEFITGADPYDGNPRAMTEDVLNNNHMWVFSTRKGFGSNVKFNPTENPLLALTTHEISGQPALANDLFRVVHDYFGHVKEGVGFRADDEENAWRAHSAMYSPLARRAMTTETRGQNSWVNYGPYGEFNRTATPDDTEYADQKIGLLPEWVSEEGRTDPPVRTMMQSAQAPQRAKRNELGLYSAVEQALLDIKLPGWKDTSLSAEQTARIAQLERETGGISSSNPRGTMERLVVAPVGEKWAVFHTGTRKEITRHYDTREEAENELVEQRADLTKQQELADLYELQRSIGGLAPGNEVWAKVSKTPGVKREELELLGLEDYLGSAAKFSREAVLDYVRDNGVNVEMITASNEKADEDQSFDWDETVDDDSSNWDHRLDDMRYEFEKDQDPWWWNWDRWVDYNQDEIANKFELTAEQVDVLAADPSRSKLEEILDDAFDYDKLADLAGSDADSAMEEAAEREYMENPYRIWEDNETDIRIVGNDDTGYTVSRRGRHIADGIYSFSEAEIQALDYARENDLFPGSDAADSETAQWGDYVTKGAHTNYREYKLTLPDIEDKFEYETHFPDPNIVAFIRVDDRTLAVSGAGRSGEPPADFVGLSGRSDQTYMVLQNELDDLEAKFPGRVDRSSNVDRTITHLEKMIGQYKAEWNNPTSKSKAFFIEELQSDWHQQGRKSGYKKNLTDEQIEELHKQQDRIAAEAEMFFQEQMPRKFKEDLGRNAGGQKWNSMSFSSLVNMARDDNSRDVAFRKTFFADIRADPVGAQMFEMLKQHEALHAQIQAERKGVPDAPFKDDSWLSLALRKALIEAVDGGYESFAWADMEVLVDRWSERYRTLYGNQYDLKMPSIIQKLTGEKPVHLTLDGKPYPKIPTEADIQAEQVELNRREQGIEDKIKALPGYPGDGAPMDAYREFLNQNPQASNLQTEANLLRVRQGELRRRVAFETPLGMWVIPLTRSFATKVKAEGFPLFQQNRGSITLLPERRIIRLGTASDLSTFLHEAGHLFLDMEAQIAAKFGISDQQQKILDWLGVATFDEIGVEHHEKWAETFEAYLREGKAPSVGLRAAFAAFSRWLTRIYQTLGGLPNAQLDDEIRGIFDRLLATQAEIDRQAGAPEYDQFFKDAKSAGMTEKEWQDYLRQRITVKSFTQMTVQEKALKQYREMRSAEWKAEREPLVEEETTRLRETPVYQVIGDITAYPMDYDAVLEILGLEKPTGRLIGKLKKGGIDPADYAEAHGYTSVRKMLDEVLAAPNLKEAATAAAEARMVEKHGDILNDGTLEQEVLEAMHSDAAAKLLLMEINALDKKAPSIDREYLQAEASKLIGNLKYKEITPDRYYRAELRAARKAATATSPAEKREAKIQQLVNHYLYREAVETRNAMGVQRRYVKRAQTRKYDTKQVEPGYAQNITALANLYDLRQQGPNVAPLVIDQFLNWYTTQINDPNQFVVLELLDENLIQALADKQAGRPITFEVPTFDDLTANQLRGLYDQLRHLRFVGGTMSDIGRAEFNEVANTIAESVIINGGNDLQDPNTVPRDQTRWLKRIEDMQDFAYGILGLRSLSGKLDNDFKSRDGVVYREIFRMVEDAANREIELGAETYEKYKAEMGDISRLSLNRNEVSITTEDGRDWTLTGSERVMLALYWGTDSSREAIMAGHSVTANDVMRMIGTLNEDQLKLVNAIWRINESFWPDLSAMATRLYGAAPPKLEALPYLINGTRMSGGHMRLYYEREKDKLQDEDKQDMQGSILAMTPSRVGSTIARVGSNGRRVQLNIDNVAQAYAEIQHGLAYAETARRIQGLINHNAVSGAIIRKHGTAFHRALVRELTMDMSARREREPAKLLARLIRRSRRAVTMAYMAYSPRNAIQGLPSLLAARDEVGSVAMVKAIGTLAVSPASTIRRVNALSPKMRERSKLMNREAGEFIRQIGFGGPLEAGWNKFVGAGFFLQKVIDGLIAYPTWLAEYEKHVESVQAGDITEREAVSRADHAVQTTVGTGQNMELGAWYKSNTSEGVRWLTTFGSWFNNYANRLYQKSGGGTLAGMTSVEFAQAALITPALMAIWGAYLVMDGPGDDENWYLWALKRYGGHMAATLPFVREAVAAANKLPSRSPIGDLAKAPISLLWATDKMLEGDRSAERTIADLTTVAGTILPVPGLGNVPRFLKYIDSYEQGREGADFSVYQALMEGPNRNN